MGLQLVKNVHMPELSVMILYFSQSLPVVVQ